MAFHSTKDTYNAGAEYFFGLKKYSRRMLHYFSENKKINFTVMKK